MKLTLFFLSIRFATWPKCLDRSLDILRTKRAFEVKQKALFIIFKRFSVAKICLRPESAPLSTKYSLKCLDHAKQSAAYKRKTTLKRTIQRSGEATGDFTGSKTAIKITKVCRTLPQNNSYTVANDHNREISKERQISSGKRQKIIDDLRLIW